MKHNRTAHAKEVDRRCPVRHRRTSDRITYAEMEARFRVWAFDMYYKVCFRSISDPWEHFGTAMAYSTKPIKDKRLILRWYQLYGSKNDVSEATTVPGPRPEPDTELG